MRFGVSLYHVQDDARESNRSIQSLYEKGRLAKRFRVIPIFVKLRRAL